VPYHTPVLSSTRHHHTILLLCSFNCWVSRTTARVPTSQFILFLFSFVMIYQHGYTYHSNFPLHVRFLTTWKIEICCSIKGYIEGTTCVFMVGYQHGYTYHSNDVDCVFFILEYGHKGELYKELRKKGSSHWEASRLDNPFSQVCYIFCKFCDLV